MIYIYFGSQFGTCECLSFSLQSFLEQKLGEKISCDSLNNFDFSIKNEDNLFIIITSTYGNGDAPENASQFFRHIKSRKLENDYFTNMKYIILGLGDSNYTQFCGFAKKIDKRISELKGTRKFETQFIDSVNEIEEEFELWLEKIKDILY
jgi:sulfite reductase alpha subunit-like flavoprotein